PAALVLRDPATQFVVTREKALLGSWRDLDLSSTHWATSLEFFLSRGDRDVVLVAPKHDREFGKLLDGLRLLRHAGVAEPNGMRGEVSSTFAQAGKAERLLRPARRPRRLGIACRTGTETAGAKRRGAVADGGLPKGGSGALVCRSAGRRRPPRLDSRDQVQVP